MLHETERLRISRLASSATERKGKSRKDSPTFYKMWEADSGDYRRRHTVLSQKRERVVADAKKEVRKWQPLRPPIYRLSHFIKSEILAMTDCA